MLSELSQAAGREINRANVAAPDPNVHRNVARAKKTYCHSEDLKYSVTVYKEQCVGISTCDGGQ